MKSVFSIVLAFLALLALPLAANAKSDNAATAKADAKKAAKANQDLLKQVSKNGARGQVLKQLSAALKQDDTLGDAVRGALDDGLRGKELAAFIQKELKTRQDKAAGDGTNAGAGQMGRGQGMGPGMGSGQGMGGQGMGPGMGGQGMGPGMGSGMGPGPRMGSGGGMGGRGGCARGPR